MSGKREKYEDKTNKNTENKSQSKKNHKKFYLSDEQLQVLPANDEEEKEILLTGKGIQATNSKRKDDLSKITKNQKHKSPNLGIMKLVQSQTLQVNKIMAILRSVRHNIASVPGASKSIRDINSELKKIQYRMSQIQNQLAKKTQQQKTRSKKKK